MFKYDWTRVVCRCSGLYCTCQAYMGRLFPCRALLIPKAFCLLFAGNKDESVLLLLISIVATVKSSLLWKHYKFIELPVYLKPCTFQHLLDLLVSLCTFQNQFLRASALLRLIWRRKKLPFQIKFLSLSPLTVAPIDCPASASQNSTAEKCVEESYSLRLNWETASFIYSGKCKSSLKACLYYVDGTSMGIYSNSSSIVCALLLRNR